jgi:hypothetical protein
MKKIGAPVVLASCAWKLQPPGVIAICSKE